ncbi:hypothetical protein [Halobellus sp. EA9]|uniref:hypothetical protein n=1 Tax=Halobellus sp. EA9 TaxID=3421647 RepID=UPI003EBB326F
MGIDQFKTYPKWVRLLKEKAEKHNLDFDADPANSKLEKSYWFEITSDAVAVRGKTHHSNLSGQREGNHIEIVYKDEKKLSSAKTEQFPNANEFEQIEVFAIVINHETESEYDPEIDDFLVLDEEALECIPPSGKKRFRIDSNGYPSPFGDHVNDWNRIFESFEITCR